MMLVAVEMEKSRYICVHFWETRREFRHWEVHIRASILQLEIKSEALNDSWTAFHGPCHVSSESINILIASIHRKLWEGMLSHFFPFDICLVSGKSQGWKGEWLVKLNSSAERLPVGGVESWLRLSSWFKHFQSLCSGSDLSRTHSRPFILPR